MTSYLAGRLAGLVPVLIFVTAVAFGLTQAAGGDPAREAAQQSGESAPAELVADLRARWGLDDPLPVRYARWIAGVARGDLGVSFLTQRPVGQEILSAYPATLLLALGALTVATLIGIPCGVLTAMARDSWIDHLGRAAAVAVAALPSFWLGLLLIVWFAEDLRWLPAGGLGLDSHLVLPAIALGALPAATVTRLVRASVLEVDGLPFVRTATAKGLDHWRVIGWHVLPNALTPAVTYLGLRFGHLLAGAVVIEQIFAWPGVGRVVLTAVSGRDLPVIAGYVLLTGLIFAAVNLIVDLFSAALDPRIRLE
ncbi:MAG TPA: ABC transporter permease [Dehalococcoidia bacterium]|nr:ABC transporter permease [Dehalococcoidia bacterium]